MRQLRLIGAALIGLLLIAASCDENTADFRLTLSEPRLELLQGESGSVIIEISSTGGFSSPVDLNVEGLPEGVDATFGANPTSTNSSLSLSLDLSAPPGTHSLTIRGVAGSVERTAPLSLVITEKAGPDFALEVSPEAIAIAQGTRDTVSVSIQTSGGFDDEITLSLEGDLGGITASFSENPARESSTLTLELSEGAAMGTRDLSLTGTAADMTKTRSLQVTVESPFGGDRLEAFISLEDPPAEPLQIGEHLSVTFVGKGQLIDKEPEEPDFNFGNVPGGEDTTLDFGTLKFNVFNPMTENEFEVTFGQPLLDAVHAFQEERGLTSGTVGIDNPARHEQFIPIPTSLSTQARSDGQDNRAILNNTTAWPWRTIAQLGGGCTGTLIGPRHVITAAHCINDWGTNNFYTVTVRPGRNGVNDVPFGSSTISNPLPPGQTGWYWTPTAWRNPDGNDTRQYDWGLIILPDRLGDQTGWMGYVARPGDDLKEVSHYNRGYPACWSNRPDRPNDCQTSKLYGNVFPCELDAFLNKGADGWNRNASHNCDTSAGHSGSAVYHYFQDPRLDNRWVPVVSMVHTWSACDRTINGVLVTCTSSDDFPSVAARLTPSRIDLISYFRNAWP